MDLFGVTIPLWAFFIGIIVVVLVAWKLIKFALKILLVIIVFIVILIGLDIVGVFAWIQENILSSFL